MARAWARLCSGRACLQCRNGKLRGGVGAGLEWACRRGGAAEICTAIVSGRGREGVAGGCN